MLDRRQRHDDEAEGDEGFHEGKFSHAGPLASEQRSRGAAARQVLVVATEGDHDRRTRVAGDRARQQTGQHCARALTANRLPAILRQETLASVIIMDDA